MRYRLFRKRSISAPRMTVSTHVPTSLKIVGGLVAFAAAVAFGVVLGRIGTAPARAGVESTIGRLMQENQQLREERVPAPPVESQQIMQGSTIKELGDQIARLESENTRLKDDVAFFEAATAGRAVPGAADPTGGIALRRFQLTLDGAARRARYRLLLTQDAKAPRDFVGTLQLVATVQRGAQSDKLVFPTPGAAPADAGDAQRYDVVFHSYKRIDGFIELPQDGVLKSVEARVLERGVIRVRLVATPE